jgi:hypothetical protein
MAGFFIDTPGLVTLHIFDSDLLTIQSRALLDWCVARGADTFTVNVVGCDPEFQQYCATVEERFARYAVPKKEFGPIPQGPPGGAWTQPRYLWSLTSESADILWSELKRGLVSCSYENGAWLEDPVLYRGREIMLGIVSHENEGVLRIRPDEQHLLDTAAIPYRLKGEWMG